jgi:hypothetical protein
MSSGKALRVCLMALVLLAGWSVIKPSQAAGWRDDLPQASLLGSGELRWFGLRIYQIALWSGQRPFDPAQPFALELTYQRSISRERLVEVSLDEMRRLFGERYSEAQFKQWQTVMRDAFIDVKAGDQLIGVSLPGIGCRFYNQERLLAEVRDVEFARAFFAIWLDPRSKDAQLRQHLMGAP